MTTSTTPISLAGTASPVSVAQELGLGLTSTIGLNTTTVRDLASIPSGTIGMNSLRGKTKASGSTITITVSANIKNFNLWNNRNASQHGASVTVSPAGSYAAGKTINLVINSGIVIGSTSNAAYSFDTGTGWSGSDVLTLNNQGYIAGAGGNAGAEAGGPAMNLQKAISITNASGYIYSGGGGGGMGMSATGYTGQGGGAGGGAGNVVGLNAGGAYAGQDGQLTRGGNGYGPLQGGLLGLPGQGGGTYGLSGGGGGGGGANGGKGGGGGTWGPGQMGGGHGVAIAGYNFATWVSGSGRVYGGTSGRQTVTLTINSNIKNFNAWANRNASQHGASVNVSGTYSAGSTDLTVVINSGIIVGSTSTTNYGFDTGTGWTAGDTISITNNGYVAGMGGSGQVPGGVAATAGGPGMNLQWPVTITNVAGYIYSGGGGGGAGSIHYSNTAGSGGKGAGNSVGVLGNAVGANHTHGGNGASAPNAGAAGEGGALNVAGAPGGGNVDTWYGAAGGGGGGGGKSGGPGGGPNAGYGTAANQGGHGLGIQRNGNAITWISGSSRVYGGIS